MIVLGLTGPTGAGKTTVLNMLREQDALVLDCDKIYYELLSTNENLRKDLVKNFGDVFLPDGSLDRQKLGTLVFGDEKALQKLNTIIYYYMGVDVRRRLTEAKAQGVKVAVIDAINLIQSGLGELCAMTVAVTASEEVRLSRIVARDGISREYALSRILAQEGEDYFARHCHAVLQNNGTEEELKEKTISLLKEFM